MNQVHVSLRVRPLVVRQHGIVNVPALPVRVPRIETEAIVRLVAVIVAVVVMRVTGADEQMQQQRCRVDDHRRRIAEVRLAIDGLPKRDGSEHYTAVDHVEVPPAGNEDAAVRRPDVLVRNPNPFRDGGSPVSRAPLIVARLPDPAARNPEIVAVRRSDVGTLLDRLGRRRQICDFFDIVVRPEAGNPLVPLRNASPITWDPPRIARNISPQPADPDEPFLLGIPAPIPGNPDDVIPFRHLVGGEFINRFGRLLFDDHAGCWIAGVGVRERLVHRPAGERLIVATAVLEGWTVRRRSNVLSRQRNRECAEPGGCADGAPRDRQLGL